MALVNLYSDVWVEPAHVASVQREYSSKYVQSDVVTMNDGRKCTVPNKIGKGAFPGDMKSVPATDMDVAAVVAKLNAGGK